jgi:hypothetical protein
MLFFIFYIACLSCNRVNDHNFDLFQSNYMILPLPVDLKDSIVFGSFGTTHLIDTNFIHKFRLLDSQIVTKYRFPKLSDYKCSYLGQFRRNDFIFLLYKTLTTQAGNGSPQVILAVFNKKGLLIEKQVILWEEVDDPLYSKKIATEITVDLFINIKSTIHEYGFLNDKLIPLKIREKVETYQWNGINRIVHIKTTENELFKENNPNVSKDFPVEKVMFK